MTMKLEKNIFSSVIGWSVLQMSVRYSWCIVFFKFCVSTLIFFSSSFPPLLRVGYCSLLLLHQTIYPSHEFCQFLFHKMWGSVVKCIYVYNSCVFLVVQLFYHYKMFYFVFNNNICFEVYFVWYQNSLSSSFCLVYALCIFLPLFCF